MSEAEVEPEPAETEPSAELMRAMFRQVRGPAVGGFPLCPKCGEYEPTCECSFQDWLSTVPPEAVAEFERWREDINRITNSERRKRAKRAEIVDDDEALVWGRGFD